MTNGTKMRYKIITLLGGACASAGLYCAIRQMIRDLGSPANAGDVWFYRAFGFTIAAIILIDGAKIRAHFGVKHND